MITTEQLLTSVTYGTPSGNYNGSSQNWVSPAVKAASYYYGRSGIQTINCNVSSFSGSITIEATLDSDPESATWTDTLSYNLSDVIRSDPLLGNFTWIRARVKDFSAGTINSITVTY